MTCKNAPLARLRPTFAFFTHLISHINLVALAMETFEIIVDSLTKRTFITDNHDLEFGLKQGSFASRVTKLSIATQPTDSLASARQPESAMVMKSMSTLLIPWSTAVSVGTFYEPGNSQGKRVCSPASYQRSRRHRFSIR